jgi:hypothetical protein
LFVGVYKLALRLFVRLLPQQSRTRAVYSKINWSDCWPGSSDLDLRIVLKDAGDSQQHFQTFKRQISFIRRYRRLFPMLNHVYVMGQPFAVRLVSQKCTNTFGHGVRVWNRVWGEEIPECETISTRNGDVTALRDAFVQYSRQVLPLFYRAPVGTTVFSRRLYTSVINVLRHCLYFRGQIDSTTWPYEASLAHALRNPALGEYPCLTLFLRRLQSMAQRDFRGSYERAELEGALVELIAYLDCVSREALRGFQYDPFTLSSVRIEDPLTEDINGSRVERVAAKYEAAFVNWIWSPNGVLPGQQTLALCRAAPSSKVIHVETLLDMHDDRSVREISPIIVSKDMFKLYLAINPHIYFHLAKYPSQHQLEEVGSGDYGSSHAMLKRVLLNQMNLLSTAFRDRNAARLLHLFIGVLPMTYLFFEKGLVCANLGECAREYADAGFAYHEQVADAYETYRSRQRRPFTAEETERTMDAYGASAMKLADKSLSFF